MVTIEVTLDDYSSIWITQDTMDKGTLHIMLDCEGSIFKLYGSVEQIEKVLNDTKASLQEYKNQIKR